MNEQDSVYFKTPSDQKMNSNSIETIMEVCNPNTLLMMLFDNLAQAKLIRIV